MRKIYCGLAFSFCCCVTGAVCMDGFFGDLINEGINSTKREAKVFLSRGIKEIFNPDDGVTHQAQYEVCQYQTPVADMNSELMEMNKDIMTAMLDQQMHQSQMNQELMQAMIMQQMHQSELMFQQQQMFQNQIHEQQMMMLQMMRWRQMGGADIDGNDDENNDFPFLYDDPVGDGDGLGE